ncbi:MAG: ATP-dependent DNA helicase Rep [Planctomycetes bacterium]|nr:ATP-dependent DNA helicase Rep [Planctomycetota bacterium]
MSYRRVRMDPDGPIGAREDVAQDDVGREDVVCLDFEVAEGGALADAGAVRGERAWRRRPGDGAERAIAELEAFAAGAGAVAGHNIVRHDLPWIESVRPRSPLLALPAIDTLLLSPLAFPAKPYHKLVKDYKLVSDAKNDPVRDATLARRLLDDERRELARIAVEDPELVAIERAAMAGPGCGAAADELARCGARAQSDAEAVDAFARRFAGRVCRQAIDSVAAALAVPSARPAVAYAAAWLSVAETSSVSPRWVRTAFPAWHTLVRALRDAPCGDPLCPRCPTAHDGAAWLPRFGLTEFRRADDGREVQREIVGLGMRGAPHLAILPTSFGKSVCYQIPAFARHERTGALTVVLSPLQALMKDQVDGFERRTGSKAAAALNGLLTPPERGKVLADVQAGDVALLYVSPEQLRNRSFRNAARSREIAAWVFDEAHCLAKWGHDFRTDYVYAGRFIREFAAAEGVPVAPVACFTATARRDVRDEILRYFRDATGQELRVVEVPPERANIAFEARRVPEAGRADAIDAELRARIGGGRAIVYLATRRRTEHYAAELAKRGWAARAFHAGLEPPVKREVQDAFKSGAVRVVCATNAFGMGIDQPDVRAVIHGDIPGSLENYLQEAGRAGRDGLPSRALLLFEAQDAETQFGLAADSQLGRKDIAQVLAAVRRRMRGDQPVVVTAAELLADQRTDVSFDAGDRDAKTKVHTAVSWLERADFLSRDENHTRVFQGRPLVKDMDEAAARIAKLGLSVRTREAWVAVLRALFHADPRQGLDMDELAAEAGIREYPDDAGNPRKSPAARLLRILRDMTLQGLVDEGLSMTAFVRVATADDSRSRFEALAALDGEFIARLREHAPDLGPASDADGDRDWARIDLRLVNADFAARGVHASPDTFRRSLHALAEDGRNSGNGRGSIELRHAGADAWRMRLLRSWDALAETAAKRRAVAGSALRAVLSKAPEGARGEVLVAFGMGDVASAVEADHRERLVDADAAVERGLLWLHEAGAITLQKGLAVFRQAMGLALRPAAHGRTYENRDYAELAEHYRERTVQIHVIAEWAKLQADLPQRARAFVADYFRAPREEFLSTWFAGREEDLRRPTSAESWRRVVEEAGDPAQRRIVTSSPDRHTLVLAGPGSGKTRVIVHRAAFLLLVERVAPESLLVLCFNRSAAHELRVRLRELAGGAARGVLVTTFHSLALRITGTDPRTVGGPGDERTVDEAIVRAVALLRGEGAAIATDIDALRERLLAGYRHVLVDEYQDVDEAQYELISAVAGRRGSSGARENPAVLMAVGDDDQNIYGWRGADARWLSRFRDDYEANVEFLVDNYRSTPHIVDAANALIAPNKLREKASHPIRPSRARRAEGRGGEFGRIDRESRGRVQVHPCADAASELRAVAYEIRRLEDRGAHTADMAVLGRTNASLHAFRSWFEEQRVAVRRRLPAGKGLPVDRVREIDATLRALDARASEPMDGAALRRVCGLENGPGANPWLGVLHRAVAEWLEEHPDADLTEPTLPASAFAAHLRELIAEERRGHMVGEGLFLGTVHGAKGLEFDHVFVLDGGGRPPGGSRDERPPEAIAAEERRVVYVAMTRARRTLHLVRRDDMANPFLAELDAGDPSWRLVREPVRALPGDAAHLRVSYELLSLEDVDLGWAGSLPGDHETHARLRTVATGDAARLGAQGSPVIADLRGGALCALSRLGRDRWSDAAGSEARILAMVVRDRETTHEDFQDRVRCDRWEVPVVEVVRRW